MFEHFFFVYQLIACVLCAHNFNNYKQNKTHPVPDEDFDKSK